MYKCESSKAIYTHTHIFPVTTHNVEHPKSHMYRCSCLKATGWRRCKGCFVFISHFPQKSSMIGGSFAERKLQLKKSSVSSPLRIKSMNWVKTYTRVHILNVYARTNLTASESFQSSVDINRAFASPFSRYFRVKIYLCRHTYEFIYMHIHTHTHTHAHAHKQTCG